MNADKDDFSDNFQITITSDLGDLAVLTFSCRGEPFEGVSEVLVIQRGDLISKIYDFRSSELWLRDRYEHKSFRGKQCGHKEAALQPFKKVQRKWFEIYFSTWLMLSFEEMFQSGQDDLTVDISTMIKSSDGFDLNN